MDAKQLAQAIKDGEQLQGKVIANDAWVDCADDVAILALSGALYCLRVKPKLEPVDMSVLIGSGIDCEFGKNGRIGPLMKCTIDGYYFMSSSQEMFSLKCKPRMDYWHSLRNCPNESADTFIMLRNAGFSVGQARDGRHLRFSGLADGFCWPWDEH